MKERYIDDSYFPSLWGVLNEDSIIFGIFNSIDESREFLSDIELKEDAEVNYVSGNILYENFTGKERNENKIYIIIPKESFVDYEKYNTKKVEDFANKIRIENGDEPREFYEKYYSLIDKMQMETDKDWETIKKESWEIVTEEFNGRYK